MVRASEQSYQTAGPSYLAYIPGGGIFTSALAGFLANGLNRYTGKNSTAPALVAMEESVLRWMCDLFGWHVRWRGDSIHAGKSLHVGSDTDYLALYCPPDRPVTGPDSHFTVGGLNHIAVVVDDIAQTEKNVVAAGFIPENFADYEPGHRFYFHDHDGIEYEIVQYD